MAGKRRDRYDKSVYNSLVLIMQFGINMLVPICMMSALGIFLDRKLGTSYLMVLLFFVGALAGGQNIYRMAKRIYDAPEEKRSVSGPGERESKGEDEDDGKGQKCE